MRLIRLSADTLRRVLKGEIGLSSLDQRPAGLILGSFDGLHRGHQELVAALDSAKARLGLKTSVVFTFHSHPRLVLGGVEGQFLLTIWRDKLSLFAQLGVDVVVAVDFIPELAALDHRSFVQRFLVAWLGMSHLVAGPDVRLGKDRAGDAAALAALGAQLGYTLELLVPATWQGRAISSSAIRRALAAGDCVAAAAMLGRPYAVWGEVGPGEGRGRQLGYRTANVEPLDPRQLLPAAGVYACLVQVPGDVTAADADRQLGLSQEPRPEFDRHGDLVALRPGRWRLYGGMLNFGHVPTFHDRGLARPRLEVHLFDFTGDLRGRTVKVHWLRRLRDERRFDGVDALLVQLGRDERAARQIVARAERPAD